MYCESSSAFCSFRRSPIAVMWYGGRYGTPCRTTELPTHLIPVVEMTRWFWIEIASAPPAQSAFTTAWMSCWWITSQSASTSGLSLTTSGGASFSVTVRPGPVTGVVPTSSDRSASCLASFGSIEPCCAWSFSMSWVSAACSRTRLALRRLCSSTRPASVVLRLGRRSVPRALVALVANSRPAHSSATGAPTRQSEIRLNLRTRDLHVAVCTTLTRTGPAQVVAVSLCVRPYKEFSRARVEQSQQEEDREGQGREDPEEAAYHQPRVGRAADAVLLAARARLAGRLLRGRP